MSTTLGQTLEEWAEQQGIEQGQLATSRRLLHRLLEHQFGSLPEVFRRRIDATTDLGRLEDAVVQCPGLRSLEELDL